MLIYFRVIIYVKVNMFPVLTVYVYLLIMWFRPIGPIFRNSFTFIIYTKYLLINKLFYLMVQCSLPSSPMFPVHEVGSATY